MRALFWLPLLLLAACGGPEANVKSQDPYERFLGERELLGRSDAEAVTQLVTLLEDKHYLVVAGAIDVLAGLGRPELIQHFVPKLKHPHPFVRQSACDAVAKIRNEEGVAPLVETSKDPEPAVRRSAVKALAVFLPNPAAAKALVEAVGDKDPSVSYRAHVILGEWSGKTGVKRSKEAWAEALK